MKHTYASIVLICAWGTLASAQDLQKPEHTEQFCAHAKTSQDETNAQKRQETIRRPVTARISQKVAGQLRFDRDTRTAHLVVPTQIPLEHPATLELQRHHELDFKLESLTFDDLDGRAKLGVLDLELELMAQAITDHELPFCERDEVRQKIRVELMAVRLLDEQGKPVAETQTLLGREIAIRRSLGSPTYLGDSVPHVAIRADKLTPEPSKAGADTWQPLRPKALSCYIPALKENARLQGAVVLRWRAGHADATVLIDTLHDDRVTSCIQDAASAVAAQAADDGSVWRATVFVKLIESSRL